MENNQFNPMQPPYYPQQPIDPKQTPLYIQGFNDGKRKQKKTMLAVFIPLLIVALIIGTMFGGSDSPEVEKTETKTTQSDKTEPSQTTEKPEMSKKEYKSACKSFDFAKVSRNPDKYKGELYKVVGEVIQVQESSILFSEDKNVELRVDVTKNEYGMWDDTIYVTYTLTSGSDRILEDDIVTIYGECTGSETYTSVLGNAITLPSVEARYIEIN